DVDELAAAPDPGVVDQDGDRPEGLLGRGDALGPVILAGDVEVDVERGLAELVGQRLAGVVEDVGDDDVRAFGAEAAGVAGAHPAGATTDEDGSSVEATGHAA